MRNYLVICLCLTWTVFSCTSRSEKESTAMPSDVKYNVEPASEWTALFKRSKGWFGGDGIFAIPFSGVDAATGDSVLFLFSDTMVGEIRDGKLQPGFIMVNNSVMILEGREPSAEKSHFRVKQTNAGTPTTLFVPNTTATVSGDYYWLGDGFLNHANDSIYIFAYRIRNTKDSSDFPFEEVGNALISFHRDTKFPYENYKQKELSFNGQSDSTRISFGAAILSNTEADKTFSPDGFVYVYGIRGKAKELVAGRVKPDELKDFTRWEFWNGSEWNKSVKNAIAIEDSVSNELSVTPIGENQYALVYQYGGIYPTINMQLATSPVGPFGPRMQIWETTNDIKDPDLFTYNAKAHPAISKPGELLISYNVNSFKFFEIIEKKPDLYRPRFIRVTFEQKN